MLFRQGVLKEKIIGLVVVVAIPVLGAFFCLLGGAALGNDEVLFLAGLCAALALIFALLMLPYLQWLEVYRDCIVVKNAYGRVNKVQFFAVTHIVTKKVPVFTRDSGIACYFFCDGRPDKLRGFLHGVNVDNAKRTVVRVPVTPEMTRFLTEVGLISTRGK